MQKKTHDNIILILIAIFVVVVDFITKKLVVAHFEGGGSTIQIIKGFFDIRMTENTGIVFGLFSGSVTPMKNIILIIMTGAATLFVVYFTFFRAKEEPFISRIALAMILGGAIGNLLDRFYNGGKVVDFLYFYIGKLHWPAFNVADSFITIGAVLLLIRMFFSREGDNSEDQYTELSIKDNILSQE